MAKRKNHSSGKRELSDTEQQLKAANQQLRASEQQLRAANQQLRATEQQLRADIVERKRAEEALRAGRDYLEKLTNSMWDAVFSVKMPGRVIEWVNDSFSLTGYEPEDCIGRTTELLYPDKREFIDFGNKLRKAIKAGEDVLHAEQMLRRKNGETFPAEITTTIFREKGEIRRVTSIVRDITERKRAEDALREERDREQKYLDVAGVMFVVIDADGKISLINKKGCEVLEYEEKEIIGKSWFDNFLPRNVCKETKLVFQQLMTGEIEPAEYHENPILTKSGEEKIIAWHNTVLKDKEGKIIGVLSSGEDITERKRAEEKLLEHQGQLKSLASELTLAEERERHRIASGLHDQISQSLASSKIELDALRHCVSTKDPDEALKEVSDSIGKAIDDMRSLTFDLSYPILYELGFETAVAEWLTERIRQKHGIATEFEDDGQPKPLDDEVCVFLFRDVRELLMNVVKHAQAKKVKVSIRKVGRQIQVSVEDDGRGFDPEKVVAMAVRKGGFGLFSIRERLGQLGGHLEIESAPGQGAKVTIMAPLKGEKNAEGR